MKDFLKAIPRGFPKDIQVAILKTIHERFSEKDLGEISRG